MKNYLKNPLSLAAAFTLVGACSASQAQNAPSARVDAPVEKTRSTGPTDTAIFAGGCFWCVESDFEKLPGVLDVVSGYTGGGTPNPSYRNHGKHFEAAKITFDPSVISYDALLNHYWVTVDPTDPTGQFCDKGHSYQTAIFARPDQIEQAERSKAGIIQTKPFDAPIVTPVLSAEVFWDAEDYHQDYYKKNPIRYKYYRNGCGRDARLVDLWGDKAVAH